MGNGTTTTGEVQRGGVLNLTRANLYKPLDEAYATHAKAQAVSYATADKTYWVSYLERGPLVVVPPDPPPAIDPLEQDNKVSKANADLTKATDQGTADVTWTAGIVAGDDLYRTEHATGVKNYQTILADIDRDQIVAQAPVDEAHTLGYLAAQTAYWTAEVAAASARRTAEATAIADWRGADYLASGSAIAGIDTAMGLPWTGYLADKAAVLSGWWINDERDNYLALTTAINAAETTYQTTVNTAFTTWATNTAAAEKTFTIADANGNYDQQVLHFAADEAYEHSLADAEGLWQNGKADNLKARRIDFWTDRRDAIAANDTTFVETWEMRSFMPDPADAPLDRAYTIAESTAHGTRRVAKATAWRDYVSQFNTAILPYVNTTATADELYTTTESTAAATRTAAIAQAIADYHFTGSESLADAIEALALANPTPWANHDAALAAASEDFTATESPAWRDLEIAKGDAERDFEISRATAQRIKSNAQAAAGATKRLTEANAERGKAIDESTAETAGAQTLPLEYHWNAKDAAASPGSTPSSGDTGGQAGQEAPNGSSHSDLNGCCGSGARPVQLPLPIQPDSPVGRVIDHFRAWISHYPAEHQEILLYGLLIGLWSQAIRALESNVSARPSGDATEPASGSVLTPEKRREAIAVLKSQLEQMQADFVSKGLDKIPFSARYVNAGEFISLRGQGLHDAIRHADTLLRPVGGGIQPTYDEIKVAVFVASVPSMLSTLAAVPQVVSKAPGAIASAATTAGMSAPLIAELLTRPGFSDAIIATAHQLANDETALNRASGAVQLTGAVAEGAVAVAAAQETPLLSAALGAHAIDEGYTALVVMVTGESATTVTSRAVAGTLAEFGFDPMTASVIGEVTNAGISFRLPVKVQQTVAANVTTPEFFLSDRRKLLEDWRGQTVLGVSRPAGDTLWSPAELTLLGQSTTTAKGKYTFGSGKSLVHSGWGESRVRLGSDTRLPDGTIPIIADVPLDDVFATGDELGFEFPAHFTDAPNGVRIGSYYGSHAESQLKALHPSLLIMSHNKETELGGTCFQSCRRYLQAWADKTGKMHIAWETGGLRVFPPGGTSYPIPGAGIPASVPLSTPGVSAAACLPGPASATRAFVVIVKRKE